MPREDVPYPMSSQICSIRERIAELQNEINGLLATINSVGGDGQKDIKLLSDNAALSITNDPVQHEIHFDLDTSQLPAADVNSVNGQTGTVVLDGDDLDGVTPGNSVNDDISALQTADGTLQGNINAEALARQNADSTLQNNINAALATIPGEVSSQIAADATINGLVAADAQNVKLTGAQSISGVKTFTANPKAANAASGATDTSVVNANWVSQTGDGGPNNLVHRSGNETISGNKEYTDGLIVTGTFSYNTRYMSQSVAAGNYNKIATLVPGALGAAVIGMFFSSKGHTNYYRNRYGIFYIRTRPGTAEDIVWINKGSDVQNKQIAVTYDGTKVELWILIASDASNESLVYTTLTQANANSAMTEIIQLQPSDTPIVKSEAELSVYQEVTFSS